MHIKILGTRGEIKDSAPYHSHHSGVLIDQTLLIDLGEREYLNANPTAILITHLHPDHAYFVSDKEERVPSDIPVFAAEKSGYSDIKLLDKKKNIAGYSVYPIPTHHSLKVKSQAYRIERGSQKILYTGDMIWINKEFHSLLEGLDLVITDGSYLRKGGLIRRDQKTGRIYGHNGIPDLIHLFKDYCQHLIFIHFGSWFYQDTATARKKLDDLARENEIIITVGYDNMRIDLSRTQN